MSEPALTATEILAWNERTAQSWRDLIESHPEILALPCDIYGVKTVAQLLQHIVAVETRYAQRLAGIPETGYEAIPYATAAELFTSHQAAMQIFHTQLAEDGDWERTMDFKTISMGVLRTSRKTMFFHALLHSIRHYAQLGTLVRQHGFKVPLPMDYLIMGATRVE
jgi:uncharacterized damage-inducible protein DinB